MPPRALFLILMAGLLTMASPVVADEPTPADDARPVGDSGYSGRTMKRHFTAPQAAAFAKQIERDLAARGARVAIVFRSGRPRDKLPQGVAYTHGAIWVYGDIRGGDGQVYKGYSSYNLYQGDGVSLPKDQSYLAQDFPIDFVSASQVDDVAVIIPSPEMQRRIMAVIAAPQYRSLHIRDYSLVSNPFDPRYQNCTEFVLDVVASAAWQTFDYTQIKADLAVWFKPTVIHANIFERVFGPVVDPRLKMDDQPDAIVTSTYESIAGFMRDNHLLKDAYVLDRENYSKPR